MYMIDEYDLFTKILNVNDHFHESNRIKQTHENSEDRISSRIFEKCVPFKLATFWSDSVP